MVGSRKGKVKRDLRFFYKFATSAKLLANYLNYWNNIL
jgi:hypothetical protein